MKIGELEVNRIYNMDCLEGMKLMPDKSVDLVLTDLPYGLNKKMSGGTWGIKYKHSDMMKWDYVVPKKHIKKMRNVSKNQIIWGGNLYALPESRCWLAWEKPKIPTLSDIELAWTSFDKVSKSFSRPRVSGKGKIHPTQKPLSLFMWCLQNHSQPTDLILDPFIGSGTTAIACIRTGRNFIGFEIDKHYCDIANQRIKEELAQQDLFHDKGQYK